MDTVPKESLKIPKG